MRSKRRLSKKEVAFSGQVDSTITSRTGADRDYYSRYHGKDKKKVVKRQKEIAQAYNFWYRIFLF